MIKAEELYAHLLESRIAGQVATPRENNLSKYAQFARRDPGVLLGLDPEGEWTQDDVLALMARRAGVSPDQDHRQGQDTIDPQLTIDALDAVAGVVARTAGRGGTVLMGTGHPGQLVGFHSALGDALEAAGCAVVTPAHGSDFLMHSLHGARSCSLDYVQRVGVVRVYEGAPPSGAPSSAAVPATGGAPARGGLSDPVHTHSPQPVRIALAALAEAGHPRPELVIGDHGWACGAGRLGVTAIGLADSNDPGVFVAEAEGMVAAAVPLDDGVRPECYELLSAYVLQQAGMSR
ncbi:phosphatase [Streptacidiphilus carbonis]|uniref:phosphatase n=1 Tax=Streptacidiphilus carbonis TaxID=105422 RepID=UPI0005A84DAB|nr:phosphatase [Streptacidiphilus carbonis]